MEANKRRYVTLVAKRVDKKLKYWHESFFYIDLSNYDNNWNSFSL
jgi:hypothetical protein